MNDLYHEIETVLNEAIQDKTVSVQRPPKDLTENYIGTYSVDDLILIVGDEQVRFSPRGRNIAGAAGRVDVVGERGEATLILEPNPPRWLLIQSRQPTLRTALFDASTLADVLKLVTRD